MDQSLYRGNDGGEPINSAGAPILAQIHSFGLTNVLIGVVRYYGGKKLGVSGLINAYRTAAKGAVENGLIIEKELRQIYTCTFNYEDMPHLMNIVKQPNVEIIHQAFGDCCELTLNVAQENQLQLMEQMNPYKSLKTINLGIK